MSTPTPTNTKRVDKIRADLPTIRAALDAIEQALASGDDAAKHDAAKQLEAFGCYVRRTRIEVQDDDGDVDAQIDAEMRAEMSAGA